MNTEDINNDMILLEESLCSNILNIENPKIKTDKLINKIIKKIKYIKTSRNNNFIETSSDNNTNITNDSMTIGTIDMPSEFFINKKKDSNTSDSFSNLVLEKSYYNESDTEKIINFK